MIVYKLTRSNGTTWGLTQWTPGEWCEATGDGPALCSDGWLHWYDHPLLAVFHDPVHGNFGPDALLWEAEAEGEILRDGQVKGGSKRLRVLRQIPLPVVTETQRVAYAILCALYSHQVAEPWRRWAERWLSKRGPLGREARLISWSDVTGGPSAPQETPQEFSDETRRTRKAREEAREIEREARKAAAGTQLLLLVMDTAESGSWWRLMGWEFRGVSRGAATTACAAAEIFKPGELDLITIAHEAMKYK